ncbi:hypothetical protein FQR65_LT06172 [Abscondita terminalis]|nr:hypothetical protein FQR65_LT06172 [Abscondita terminalis]
MTSVKNKSKNVDIISYSDSAIRNNASVVEYCRTSMAALSGCTAGLLGFTGLYGAAFYVFAVTGLWGLLLFKAGSDWQQYFVSRKSLLTNGFFGQLFTYVLCWTFIYGMVHVY